MLRLMAAMTAIANSNIGLSSTIDAKAIVIVAIRLRAQKKAAPRSNPMEAMASEATNPTPQNRAINVSGWGMA
jgi:hypothetical protein